MGWKRGRGRKTWIGEDRGPRGHVGLSQLDLSLGPAENGIEAGVTGFLSPELGW